MWNIEEIDSPAERVQILETVCEDTGWGGGRATRHLRAQRWETALRSRPPVQTAAATHAEVTDGGLFTEVRSQDDVFKNQDCSLSLNAPMILSPCCAEPDLPRCWHIILNPDYGCKRSLFGSKDFVNPVKWFLLAAANHNRSTSKTSSYSGETHVHIVIRSVMQPVDRQ